MNSKRDRISKIFVKWGLPTRQVVISEILKEIESDLIEKLESLKKPVGGGRGQKEAYKRTYNTCPDCGVDITNRHVFALRCCDCSLKRNKQQAGNTIYNKAIKDIMFAMELSEQ